MKIPFKIEHIDPLGQGVSKLENTITFIKKSLPGETGLAHIFRTAKGVQFATVCALRNKSPLRLAPPCPHFDRCNSCDYLHTDYQNELNFKQLAFKRHLSQEKNIIIHPSPERLGYRNRIQLHYNHNKLGFISPQDRSIIEIPHCLLPVPPIQEKIQALYKNESWKKLTAGHRKNGHIEIYLPPKKSIKLSINKGYADGGFSQVNTKMNPILTDIVTQNILGTKVLDLFGGDGNLSQAIHCEKRWIIDLYNLPREDCFINCDLFSLDAHLDLKKQIDSKIDLMIIDPPRRGFKEIVNFTNYFTPQRIIYVSCNMATQMRDINNINQHYQITECHLVDLFPGTSHFETVIILDRNQV